MRSLMHKSFLLIFHSTLVSAIIFITIGVRGCGRGSGVSTARARQDELTYDDWARPDVPDDDYGDITEVDTTGASMRTARQDKLTYDGVEASHTMMETDLQRVNRYKTLICDVAQANQIDPAIIGAIISRESRGGAALINGWGDNGNGFGLMQVDERYHESVGAWNSQEHLEQGTEILIDMIKAIKRKFPNWTLEQQLKGGISAYNAGPGNVRTYDRMDIGTTGNDYANDVVARAQALKMMGY